MGRAGAGGGGHRSSGGGHSVHRSSGGHRISSGGGSRSRAGSGSRMSSGGYTPPPSYGMPRRRRYYRHYGYGGYGGAGGFSVTLIVILFWIFFIAVAMGMFRGIGGGSSYNNVKSTIVREKIVTGNAYINDCIIDEIGWFNNPTKTAAQLKSFWEETGVQPYIILKAYDATLKPARQK